MDDMDRRIAPHHRTDAGPMDDIAELVQDYRLTTAEILYHMPDFPKLNEFLSCWEKQLKGELHSVRIGYVGIIQPAEWHFSDCLMTTH